MITDLLCVCVWVCVSVCKTDLCTSFNCRFLIIIDTLSVIGCVIQRFLRKQKNYQGRPLYERKGEEDVNYLFLGQLLKPAARLRYAVLICLDCYS